MAGTLKNTHNLFDIPIIAVTTLKIYHKNTLEIEFGFIVFGVLTMPAYFIELAIDICPS
jgi:hypothetical protein